MSVAYLGVKNAILIIIIIIIRTFVTRAVSANILNLNTLPFLSLPLTCNPTEHKTYFQKHEKEKLSQFTPFYGTLQKFVT